MKSAGKARSNGLYRHIRTSKEIIRNLLNDSDNNQIIFSILYKKYIYMKRRNDQSTYKFNGAIATILLQFRHIFYLSCIKFLLKVCSNHGIIGLDYFILRHGHFVHGYYIW